ncbi:MAG TPA: murein biosynthesis integral membrane protein MurJ [Dermatophilaceae bacterium]|nr:murein biosynthesis integral membrane protein MurJ [Dermatophilaceae bacterium]
MTESSNNDAPVSPILRGSPLPPGSPIPPGSPLPGGSPIPPVSPEGPSSPDELPDSAEASLARSTAGMASGVIASRVLGVVRASMQLAVVGAGLSGDAWDVANTLPNIVYLLLAGGVINAVLVPQITRAASHADGGRDFVDRLLTISITGLAVITVVFTVGAGLLVRLYSSGWNADVRSLSTAFALICMPQIFFYGLYTLLGNVLNARNHFAAYMWAPVLANIVAIGGMAYFLLEFPRQAVPDSWSSPMIWVLAGSATLGIVAQALVLVVPLWRSGFRYTPRWGFRGVGLGTASRVALWTFAALGVSSAGFVITSKVATFAGQAGASANVDVPGKISYTSAFLIFMLPHSLVTVTLVTALFTRMSRAAGAGNLSEVRADVDRGMRLTAVATVPATVGAFVLGFAATATLFAGNSAASTRGIATVMMAMMVGLVPYGVLFLLQRVFYAFEDAKTPFRLTVVVTVIATLANLASLLLPLRWIVVGVGAGQALSNFAAVGIGLVLVRRRLNGLPLSEVTRTYVRLGAASLVAGAAALIVQFGLAQIMEGKLYSPVSLVAGGLVFAAVYVVVARRLRVHEIDDLAGPVLARVRRALPKR